MLFFTLLLPDRPFGSADAQFIENSPDIPDELIRAVRDGDVMFLCGAGVSFGAGLPTFRLLTEQVYARLGEDLNYEHAEITAFNQYEIRPGMRLNTMVLVGYRAEDAAMRLLLETLDADRERFTDLRDIYAMEVQQPGSASIWKAKGIKPIEFDDYDILYATLAEWAEYAMDPNGYQLAKARAILGKKI